jgi:hypothetical protein
MKRRVLVVILEGSNDAKQFRELLLEPLVDYLVVPSFAVEPLLKL